MGVSLSKGGNGDEWTFRAIGQGYASGLASGLAGIAKDFGVNV